MKTIFVIRPFGFNIGNDAIAIAVRGWIRETFGQIVNVISIPATSKYEGQSRGGLTKQTIHEINQYGDGVIVGGGNIFENGELDCDVDALGELAPPMMMFSLSRGKIFNRAGELVTRTDTMHDRTLKALHKKAVISAARDTATVEYLNSIGCERVSLGGCPTIFMDRFTTNLEFFSSRHDKQLCLLSVRNPNLMNVPLQLQAQLHRDIVEIIATLKGKYEHVSLLCHDHRDLPFAASFPDCAYLYTGDVLEYLALLKHAALNVTFRVHSALPCMSFGTPFVKISYDERAISLMETVGFGNWNLSMMDHESIVPSISQRCEELGNLPKIKAAASSQWGLIEKNQRDAFEQFHNAVLDYQKTCKY